MLAGVNGRKVFLPLNLGWSPWESDDATDTHIYFGGAVKIINIVTDTKVYWGLVVNYGWECLLPLASLLVFVGSFQRNLCRKNSVWFKISVFCMLISMGRSRTEKLLKLFLRSKIETRRQSVAVFSILFPEILKYRLITCSFSWVSSYASFFFVPFRRCDLLLSNLSLLNASLRRCHHKLSYMDKISKYRKKGLQTNDKWKKKHSQKMPWVIEQWKQTQEEDAGWYVERMIYNLAMRRLPNEVPFWGNFFLFRMKGAINRR